MRSRPRPAFFQVVESGRRPARDRAGFAWRAMIPPRSLRSARRGVITARPRKGDRTERVEKAPVCPDRRFLVPYRRERTLPCPLSAGTAADPQVARGPDVGSCPRMVEAIYTCAGSERVWRFFGARPPVRVLQVDESDRRSARRRAGIRLARDDPSAISPLRKEGCDHGSSAHGGPDRESRESACRPDRRFLVPYRHERALPGSERCRVRALPGASVAGCERCRVANDPAKRTLPVRERCRVANVAA